MMKHLNPPAYSHRLVRYEELRDHYIFKVESELFELREDVPMYLVYFNVNGVVSVEIV